MGVLPIPCVVFEEVEGEREEKACVVSYVCLFRYSWQREGEGKKGKVKGVS